MRPDRHARYLDYRERHVYFGKLAPRLGPADFEAADEELEALDALGEDARDDEQAARHAELRALLFRD